MTDFLLTCCHLFHGNWKCHLNNLHLVEAKFKMCLIIPVDLEVEFSCRPLSCCPGEAPRFSGSHFSNLSSPFDVNKLIYFEIFLFQASAVWIFIELSRTFRVIATLIYLVNRCLLSARGNIVSEGWVWSCCYRVKSKYLVIVLIKL